MDLDELFSLLGQREFSMTTDRQGISKTVIHLGYITPRPCVTQLDVLRQMRTLLTEHWCRHAEARDVDGKSVIPWEPEAFQWCMIGAVKKIIYEMPRQWLGWCLDPDVVAAILGFNDAECMAEFNDYRGHAAVLHRLDDKIACLDHQVRASM